MVNAGDRIGLVANGRGKSTLVRGVAGAMEARDGEITRSRGLTIGCVGQHVPGLPTAYLVPAISHSRKLPSVVLQFL